MKTSKYLPGKATYKPEYKQKHVYFVFKYKTFYYAREITFQLYGIHYKTWDIP